MYIHAKLQRSSTSSLSSLSWEQMDRRTEFLTFKIRILTSVKSNKILRFGLIDYWARQIDTHQTINLRPITFRYYNSYALCLT